MAPLLVGFVVLALTLAAADRWALDRVAVGAVLLVLLVASRNINAPAVSLGRVSRNAALLAFIGFALAIRLPTIIWPATIGWDENTFLTVAAQALNGGLPYVTTFDNKGPISVLANMIPLALASDSLETVRIALAVAIGATGFLVMQVGVALGARRIDAGITGLLFVGFATVVSDSPGMWHTAHTGNLIVAAILLLLITSRQPVVIGALLGALVLTRGNYLVTVAVLAPLWLATQPTPRRWKDALRLASGAALVAAAVALPYVLSGTVDRLWAGLVTVNLAQGHGTGGASALPREATLMLAAVILLSVVAFVQTRAGTEHAAKRLRRLTLLNAGATVGTATSIALTDVVHEHHALLLLVFPVVQLGAVLAAASRRQSSERLNLLARSAGLASVALILGLVLQGVDRDAVRFDATAAQREAAVLDAVAAALVLDADAETSLWALSEHHVYWRLDRAPVDPLVTHPSSLAKPGFRVASPPRAGAADTTSEAAAMILSLRPSVIVGRDDLGHSYLDQPSRDLLRTTLDRDYSKVATTGPVTIWKFSAEGVTSPTVSDRTLRGTS